MGFLSIAPRVASLLAAGIADARNKDYTFHLIGGDLQQMSTQESFLRARGLDVRRNNVYPCVKTKEDYVRALRLFWESKIPGWWNYRTEFLRHKICTEAEYMTEAAKN